ncbi:MAG: hypothetical protein ACTS3R_13485 [Inquilinaceae bacterium]
MLAELLSAIEGSAIASGLRVARWGYAAVNAGHIVGIALLFGSIVPLDLRLMGFWRSVPVPDLARVLVPVSVAGLVLAAATGALLFSVGATDYAAMPLFQIKLLLILAAVANALLLRRLAGPSPRWKAAGALSLCLWLAVIACGRALGYL